MIRKTYVHFEFKVSRLNDQHLDLNDRLPIFSNSLRCMQFRFSQYLNKCLKQI